MELITKNFTFNKVEKYNSEVKETGVQKHFTWSDCTSVPEPYKYPRRFRKKIIKCVPHCMHNENSFGGFMRPLDLKINYGVRVTK